MSLRNPLPVKWTDSAWNDLDNIAEYLLNKCLAHEVVEDYIKRLFKGPEHLAIFPGAGKPGRVANTREWRVRDTPYALIYAVHDNKVHILRVMHDSRRFP